MALAYASRRRTGRMPQAPSRRMGTWKLAYADFLTALVALFLVLWLVKGVPESGRQDLANYFRDPSSNQQTSTMQMPTAASGVAAALLERLVASGLENAVEVVSDDGRVRIDIVDRSTAPLFATSQAQFTPAGMATLDALSDMLVKTPWPVSIEGHTDAFPSARADADNWDISTDRAQAARRHLLAHGLDSARIISVTGLADTLPLNAGEPHLAANRRVTLVLHVTP